MSSLPAAAVAAPARGVTATGWYIATSILVFLAATLFAWGVAVFVAAPVPAIVVAGIGAAVVVVACVVQLTGYAALGEMDEQERAPLGRRLRAWPVLLGVGGAVLFGVCAGAVLPGVSLAAAVLCLVRWPRGIRFRGVALLTVLLWALAIVETPRLIAAGWEPLLPALAVFAVLLPATVALSLWSWDIVLELDRSRVAQARLAAVQERLRLAGELHDLQGHHLQVIALQLELAERMLERDPAAAAEQIALARASVDEARAGTRELAGRFRGVPLPDELANAADLLRAAGLRVELDVAVGAESAPTALLGPVVRECATNVLKHGGGQWARLSLRRDRDVWALRIANDVGEGSALGEGAGLAGIALRIAAAGGAMTAGAAGERFEVAVTVPTEENA